jgi:hypothetical protein
MSEQLTIAGLPVEDVKSKPVRTSFIIWGNIGAAKTTLACTAPSPIMFLMWDHGGADSIRSVSDRFSLVDCTAEDPDFLDQFMSISSKGCVDIDKALATGRYKTLVLDSLTSLMERALLLGIDKANRTIGRGTRGSIWDPGLRGYGARLTATRNVVMNLHAICARHDVNFIVTAHIRMEKQIQEDESVRIFNTLAIGGEAYVSTPKNFSEIWCLREEADGRYIQVRTRGAFGPCRTRMFMTENRDFRFPWRFDPYKWEGEGIEGWMQRWETNEQRPIRMPK